MAEPPQVSIVVVNHNGGPLLQRCLERALASTVAVEVILVDNASTDGSLAAARRLPGVHCLENRYNLGFARAANQGLARARAPWRLLLNPDCLLEPDTLARMLSELEGHPRVGMAGCRILDPDGREQRGCRRRLPDLGRGLAKALGKTRGATAMDLHRQPLPEGPIEVEAISGAFMLVRAEALAQVGGLDEGYFLHCEDLDWCKGFQDAGWRILFVPQVEVVHHQGQCSQAKPLRVSWHKHRGMARYYRKHLAPHHPWPLRYLVLGAIGLRFVATLPRVLWRARRAAIFLPPPRAQ